MKRLFTMLVLMAFCLCNMQGQKQLGYTKTDAKDFMEKADARFVSSEHNHHS